MRLLLSLVLICLSLPSKAQQECQIYKTLIDTGTSLIEFDSVSFLLMNELRDFPNVGMTEWFCNRVIDCSKVGAVDQDLLMRRESSHTPRCDYVNNIHFTIIKPHFIDFQWDSLALWYGDHFPEWNRTKQFVLVSLWEVVFYKSYAFTAFRLKWGRERNSEMYWAAILEQNPHSPNGWSVTEMSMVNP